MSVLSLEKPTFNGIKNFDCFFKSVAADKSTETINLKIKVEGPRKTVGKLV
jgi:hypothetical protein